MDTAILFFLLITLLDLLGCVIAVRSGIPFKNLYWIPLGGWLALWLNRRTR